MHSDIDECATQENKCSVNTVCSNSEGSYNSNVNLDILETDGLAKVTLLYYTLALSGCFGESTHNVFSKFLQALIQSHSLPFFISLPSLRFIGLSFFFFFFFF